MAIDASADNIDAARSHATRDPALHRNLEYRAVTAGTKKVKTVTDCVITGVKRWLWL